MAKKSNFYKRKSETGYSNVVVKDDSEVIKRTMHEKTMDIVLECLGKKHETRGSYFSHYSESVCRKASMLAQQMGKSDGNYYFKGKLCYELDIGGIGIQMENTDAMLKKTIDEIKESKKIIQDLHNEINAAYDPTLLKLGEMIKGIRAKRQTVVMELRQSLSAMKDVRSFFLDKDYKQEMDRLERFVILGERLKKLIDDGTLDAVCDAALKLAVPEEGEKL